MARRNKEDPTGQGRSRKRGATRLSVRLTRAERQIKALFRAVPRQRRSEQVITNDSQIVYDYALTPVESEQLQAEIRAILDDELLETQEDSIPPLWWWQNVVEQPYRQGTMQEVVQFNQLIAGAAAAGVLIDGFPPQKVPPAQVLSSPTYLQSLQGVYVENFQSIKGLSDTTAKQVIQQITSGVQSGNTPTQIREAITDRFGVAKSRAKRIAGTEINKAYTDSLMNATDIISEKTSLAAGVIHISALTPTTRATHAARHGNAYTTNQQTTWWNEGANRINCKCSVKSILVDKRTGKIIDTAFQEEIKAERSFFDK